ncbi:MAG: CRISPR system precrRNA processing endoribonuclease RAMP protein Cas6 [Chloroflexales bacterium]
MPLDAPISAPSQVPTAPPTLPPLPLLRARLTMRLLSDATLPAYKGGMLRGGFGYAFQRVACAPACRSGDQPCPATQPCPFRVVFDTLRPAEGGALHDLRDVPRPFVLGPPADERTHYAAGESLEFDLTMIGRGADYLPYFILSFEELGRMGLGRDLARARLERVELLPAWHPVGAVIYHDGRSLPGGMGLPPPYTDTADVLRRAGELPSRLRLTLRAPLRIKQRGDFMRVLDPAALIQAACWRIDALATFHGTGPWGVRYQPLVDAARAITVEHAQVRWHEWQRTSTRGHEPKTMQLGGLLGSAVLTRVPESLRAVLLLGSLVHVGKACVFGHGAYSVGEG